MKKQFTAVFLFPTLIVSGSVFAEEPTCKLVEKAGKNAPVSEQSIADLYGVEAFTIEKLDEVDAFIDDCIDKRIKKLDNKKGLGGLLGAAAGIAAGGNSREVQELANAGAGMLSTKHAKDKRIRRYTATKKGVDKIRLNLRQLEADKKRQIANAEMQQRMEEDYRYAKENERKLEAKKKYLEDTLNAAKDDFYKLGEFVRSDDCRDFSIGGPHAERYCKEAMGLRMVLRGEEEKKLVMTLSQKHKERVKGLGFNEAYLQSTFPYMINFEYQQYRWEQYLALLLEGKEQGLCKVFTEKNFYGLGIVVKIEGSPIRKFVFKPEYGELTPEYYQAQGTEHMVAGSFGMEGFKDNWRYVINHMLKNMIDG